LKGRAWTEEEISLIRENMTMPDAALGEKLNRSTQAIGHLKHRLRRGEDAHVSPTQEFDLRPSGWYGEVIGTALMDYEDAWNSWRHYHRYVEVKIISSDDRGWTSLLCRRDENAA
jgi:hypothetical protein